MILCYFPLMIMMVLLASWCQKTNFHQLKHLLKTLLIIVCRQSFTTHLLQLMTSWAVVCDVWYLEPQNLKPGETPIEFAERFVSFCLCMTRLYLVFLVPESMLQNPKSTCNDYDVSSRVRDIISVRAGLKKVPWDGYLKYSRPSPKHRERK